MCMDPINYFAILSKQYVNSHTLPLTDCFTLDLLIHVMHEHVLKSIRDIVEPYVDATAS